jgi:hypothetical protein
VIYEFPLAYPDESLLSLCVRYHGRVRYCLVANTVTELFGGPRLFPSPALPGHLGHLAAELPAPRDRVEWLIHEYTLLPYYAPFQPHNTLASMKWAMTAGRTSDVYKHIGVIAYHRFQPQALLFCPECCRDDSRAYGETYWRRSHQLPGVKVCITHQVFLDKSLVLSRGINPTQAFKPASLTNVRWNSRPLNLTKTADLRLLEIARVATWLLWDCKESFNVTALRLQYWRALGRQGLVTSQRLDVRAFVQRFTDHFSASMLQLLDCEIKSNRADGWLNHLINWSSKAKHPLAHLLLMNFLGIQPDSATVSS